MATLFAMIIVAMVASFGLVPEKDLAIDAGVGTQALVRSSTGSTSDDRELTRTVASTTSTTEAEEEAEADDGVVVYETAMDDLAVHDATAYEEGVLSSEPEEAPSSPTTAAPTTTAATTTTTAAEETTSSETAPGETTPDGETTTTTAGDGSDTSPSSDTTDTTVPTDTTTPETSETTEAPAPSNPDGFVDAGHGVLVPPVLLKIRFCESTDNYTAANPNSSARGAYQFLTGSWAAYGHAERYGVNQAHLATPAQQDEAALLTWQRDGTRPWNASRSCWG